MRTYIVKRKGRNFINDLQKSLIVGDITNFHIKGRTKTIAKGEYEIIK